MEGKILCTDFPGFPNWCKTRFKCSSSYVVSGWFGWLSLMAPNSSLLSCLGKCFLKFPVLWLGFADQPNCVSVPSHVGTAQQTARSVRVQYRQVLDTLHVIAGLFLS